MSDPSKVIEWTNQAEGVLRHISSNRLHIKQLFPNKEHLQPKLSSHINLRESFQTFFSKSLASLVPIDTITDLLKQASDMGVPEHEKEYIELKKVRKEALMLQLRAKELLASQSRTYIDVKYALGEVYNIGVTFNEAEKLKTIMDDNRAIEMGLCFNFLSIAELEEMQNKLGNSKGCVDKSFAGLVEEKLQSFRVLDSKINTLLNRHVLTADNLKQVCLVLDEAEKIKFKLENFRFICGIRDSFRWVHMLKAFLEGNVYTQEKFERIASKPAKTDITSPINLEILKRKLAALIRVIEQSGDFKLFKAILAPVEDVQLTDDSIRDIIDYLKTSKWTFDATSKIEANSMTSESLEQVILSVPAVKRQMQDPVYIQLEGLHQSVLQYRREVDRLLQEIKSFMEEADENIIVVESRKQKIQEFRQKVTDLNSILNEKLTPIVDLHKDENFEISKGLVSLLEISYAINSKSPLDRDNLKKLKVLLNTSELVNLKENVIMKQAMKFYNKNIKIIRFFERLAENEQLDMALRDDIIVVNEYHRIITFEEKSIDYSAERGLLESKLERFRLWEQKVETLCQKYELDNIEQNFDEFKANRMDKFEQEIHILKKELKNLSFKSITVEKLLILAWCVEVLYYFKGDSKKRISQWQSLLKKGRMMTTTPKNYIDKIKREIASADALVLLGHQVYKENTSYKAISDLKDKIHSCSVDMTDELSIFKERFDIQDELIGRIRKVLDVDVRLKLVEIEKLVDEVKTSGIDFEDIAESLEKTLQVCRAFAVAIKEMKKTPTEIKRARQTYKLLPLISQNFEHMLSKLEEEESLLDNLDSLMNDDQLFNDFEKITELETNLGQVRFYDLSESKIELFKRKILILEDQAKKSESDFTIPFLVVRSMRLESNELVRHHPNDKALQQLDKFLTDIDLDVRGFLDSLLDIKNLKAFSKIKQTIYGFIDISSELLDLQAKVKLNLQRGSSNYGLEEAKTMLSATNQRGVIRIPQSNSKRFELNLSNLKKSINKTSSGAPTNQRLERQATNASDQKTIPARKPDIRTLRSNLLGDLKYEIARNPNIHESELEITSIAAYLEKIIFTKSQDGTYELKMKKITNLFSNILDMKKLTCLISLKNFDLNLLLFMMEKPPQVLQIYERNKDKLLVDMGFGSFVQDTAIDKPQAPKSAEERKLEALENSLNRKLSRPAETLPPKFADPGIPIRRRMDQDSEKELVASLRSNIAGGSSFESEEDFRIKRKSLTGRSSQEVQRELYKKQLLRPTEDFGTEEPLAYNIYKGEMFIETEILKTHIKYLNLITFDDPSKYRNLPALQPGLRVRGTVKQTEFMSYLGKLIRKNPKGTKFVFGYLESDGISIQNLNHAFFGSKTFFFSKYAPECKILLFPKKHFLTSWIEPLQINQEKLSQIKSQIYWLKIINEAQGMAHFSNRPVINPFPLYSLNLRGDTEGISPTALTPISSEIYQEEEEEEEEATEMSQNRVQFANHQTQNQGDIVQKRIFPNMNSLGRIRLAPPSFTSQPSNLLELLKFGGLGPNGISQLLNGSARQQGPPNVPSDENQTGEAYLAAPRSGPSELKSSVRLTSGGPLMPCLPSQAPSFFPLSTPSSLKIRPIKLLTGSESYLGKRPLESVQESARKQAIIDSFDVGKKPKRVELENTQDHQHSRAAFVTMGELYRMQKGRAGAGTTAAMAQDERDEGADARRRVRGKVREWKFN